jgi:hypothetical protein
MSRRQLRRAQREERGENMSFEKLWELEKVLDHYGAECNCCGQTQKMVLTAVRINHRWQRASELYRQIIKDGFPGDIQILCFNCKRFRQANGGIWPHKTNWRVQPKKEGEINAQTMTTGHPMWDRFADSIATLLETHECDNTLTISRELLVDMRIFDVDGSIEWLQDHAGFCDCEVLLNVDGVEWTDI